MGDEGELLKLSSCRQGSQLWWNGISFMLSQLLLHIYINCTIALVDFDLLNLMGLEDLINIYMYIISQTSTCLCVPRHTHAMTHTMTRQTYGACQAIPVSQQDTGCRSRPGSVAALGVCPGISRRTFRGRTQHSWCNFFVTGQWGSRHPRAHRDRKGQARSGSVLSGSLLRQKCRVVCPGLHPDTSASLLSCWDRSPMLPRPWNTAWGIPDMSVSRAQHSVNVIFSFLETVVFLKA